MRRFITAGLFTLLSILSARAYADIYIIPKIQKHSFYKPQDYKEVSFSQKERELDSTKRHYRILDVNDDADIDIVERWHESNPQNKAEWALEWRLYKGIQKTKDRDVDRIEAVDDTTYRQAMRSHQGYSYKIFIERLGEEEIVRSPFSKWLSWRKTYQRLFNEFPPARISQSAQH